MDLNIGKSYFVNVPKDWIMTAYFHENLEDVKIALPLGRAVGATHT